MNDDEKYMEIALNLAKKCIKHGDVPVGCVIVKNNKIIAKSFNKRNKKNNALAHAEIIAIDKACKKVHDWVLEGCSMYVTMEPCVMCAGSIVQARLDRLVYGTSSDKNGCCGTLMNLVNNEKLTHKVEVTSNVMKDECSEIIKEFFIKLREEKRK